MKQGTVQAHPLVDVWSWSMPSQWVAGQFDLLNQFVVVNSESRVAAEGFFSESEANSGCSTFNEHETRYGRPAIYNVIPIPKKLHNYNANQWQKFMDEGEEIRQPRIDAIPKLMKSNYPSAFIVLASQYLEKVRGPQLVDWTAVHDEFLGKSIGVDVRNPPRALSELLHYSPGAVTHAEQDVLCMRLETLLAKHVLSNERGTVRSNRPHG